MATILNKYNRPNEKSKAVSIASSSSNSNLEITGGNVTLDRSLWGNEDNGGDIEETIQVQGSVYARSFDYADEESDDDDADESKQEFADDPDDDGNGGYVFGEKMVKSPIIKSTKQIFLPYPTQTDSLKDLAPLIKGHSDRITNLEGRMTTAEGNITNLGNRVTNVENHQADQDVFINANVSEIINIKGELANLSTTALTEERVLELIQANAQEVDKNAPVVLFSGTIYSDNNDSDKTWQPWSVKANQSSYHSGISSLELIYQSVTNSTPSLRVSCYTKNGYICKITSISAMVKKATDYNIESSNTGGNPRSRGYWMTGGVDYQGVGYLAAWRTQDDNNDSVRYDCMAYKVQEVNLTIYGTCYKS